MWKQLKDYQPIEQYETIIILHNYLDNTNGCSPEIYATPIINNGIVDFWQGRSGEQYKSSDVYCWLELK